jgi:hypothetical protein
MAACRSFSKNIGKINMQPILNKNSPRARMELGFDVLDVAKKLLNYIVHSLKKNSSKKLSFHRVPKQAMSFWSQ